MFLLLFDLLIKEYSKLNPRRRSVFASSFYYLSKHCILTKCTQYLLTLIVDILKY